MAQRLRLWRDRNLQGTRSHSICVLLPTESADAVQEESHAQMDGANGRRLGLVSHVYVVRMVRELA